MIYQLLMKALVGMYKQFIRCTLSESGADKSVTIDLAPFSRVSTIWVDNSH